VDKIDRRKYIGKPPKKYCTSFESKIKYVSSDDLKGFISYFFIKEIKIPLIVEYNNEKIYLYNNGYSEIGYLPDNSNWSLCAIYDNYGRIIEWYIDITEVNTVDEIGQPYCKDLYLDIVLLPDGKIIILDEDELKESLENKIISQNEYELAYNVKNSLIENGLISVPYMENLCKKIQKILEL